MGYAAGWVAHMGYTAEWIAHELRSWVVGFFDWVVWERLFRLR
jgi:hypothetical protein